ncbi:MAG: HAMP domain-containing sensor histidine kinase [Actinomycetota bacterium]
MRRLLVVLMAATTTTVVIAFVLPLALAIRSVERTDEINGIVNSAAALGAFIDDGTPTVDVEEAILRYEAEFPNIDVTVYGEDGSVVGVQVPANNDVAAAFAGQQIVDESSGGVTAYVPQKGPFDAEGRSSFVIRLAASGDVIDLGVRSIGAVIALSTIISILVGGGMGLLAARMIATPTQNVTDVARRLQHGELDARATPSGPAELRELAETLNHLAARVAELLVRERESVADLAHRLRTPLTALHLEIETLDPTPETEELLARVQRLEATLNQILAEMRRPEEHEKRTVDVAAIARDRLTDWSDVAIDAGRPFHVRVEPAGPRRVTGDPADVEAAFDTIINNAFKHTPEGTRIDVSVVDDGDRLRFSVEDAGPGFPDDTVAQRGVSAGQSSGLGLDIARRTVEAFGGEMRLGRSELGGARVVLLFEVDQGGGGTA